tara:strand:- start:267 stop:494 length:228 start_codon:yes stop_codon:yes gene_type:complete
VTSTHDEALSVRRVVFAAERISIPGDFYDAPLAWGEIDREGRVDGRCLAIEGAISTGLKPRANQRRGTETPSAAT